MAGKSASLSAPHRSIKTKDLKEKFTLELFDTLWNRYKKRVSYVQTYEKICQDSGAEFVNDHIAFRTLACRKPATGIISIAPIIQALGYLPAGCYTFPEKNLAAIHYRHPNASFPKIFISELKTWELPAKARSIILKTVKSHRPHTNEETLAKLYDLKKQSKAEQKKLLNTLVKFFRDLPWKPPQAKDIKALNKVSQYGAWTAVHGYDVNHFTALVNSHKVKNLNDIDKTIKALKKAGVPTKDSIEGKKGSKLRQSATGAVTIDVKVSNGNKKTNMPWTYAYFEIAERGNVKDPGTGKKVRFEGFLGPQASQLFEMTRVK